MSRPVAAWSVAWVALGSAASAVAGEPTGCRAPAEPGQLVSPQAAERLRLAPGTLRGERAGELRLRDGRMLEQSAPGEPARIYSVAGYRAHVRARAEELRRRGVHEGDRFHPLRGLIDDGPAFVAEVPSLAGALAHRLEREGLAPDAAGMATFAARWRGAGCRLDPAVVRELSAGLGDLVVRAAGTGGEARWTTRAGPAEASGVIEPVIEGTRVAGGKAPSVTPWSWALRLLGGELLGGATPDSSGPADEEVDLGRTISEAATALAPSVAASAPPPPRQNR